MWIEVCTEYQHIIIVQYGMFNGVWLRTTSFKLIEIVYLQ